MPFLNAVWPNNRYRVTDAPITARMAAVHKILLNNICLFLALRLEGLSDRSPDANDSGLVITDWLTVLGSDDGSNRDTSPIVLSEPTSQLM